MGLENIKSSRDAETQIGYLQGWFKDTVAKIDEMQESLDNLQNNAFEDIKSRLVQSEKSKASLGEFNGKVENALKHIIKYQQANEGLIVVPMARHK